MRADSNQPKPPFRVPTAAEILEVLREHPLVRLAHEPRRVFLVGSFSGGSSSADSDVDVLLEVAPTPGVTASELTTNYRLPLQRYFMQHGLRGRHDEVHPQWCGRRLDLYFTYDAGEDERPKLELDQEPPASQGPFGGDPAPQ